MFLKLISLNPNGIQHKVNTQRQSAWNRGPVDVGTDGTAQGADADSTESDRNVHLKYIVLDKNLVVMQSRSMSTRLHPTDATSDLKIKNVDLAAISSSRRTDLPRPGAGTLQHVRTFQLRMPSILGRTPEGRFENYKCVRLPFNSFCSWIKWCGCLLRLRLLCAVASKFGQDVSQSASKCLHNNNAHSTTKTTECVFESKCFNVESK